VTPFVNAGGSGGGDRFGYGPQSLWTPLPRRAYPAGTLRFGRV
jgi:hypothetical protein